MTTKPDESMVDPRSIDVTAWQEPARRVHQLQLMQAITLGMVCLATVVVVGLVGRSIVDSTSTQRRANAQLRELADVRAPMLTRQAEVWHLRAQGASPVSASLFTDYAAFRTGMLRLAHEGVGGDGPAATTARNDALAAIAAIDTVLGSVIVDRNNPQVIANALAQADAPAARLTDGTARWLSAATAQVAEMERRSRRLSWQLLGWIAGLVGALGLVGMAIWFGLNRARLRLIESLQASEERFRSLVENSSDAVMVIDSDGAIVYASPPTEHLFGYHPADLVDIPLCDLVHPVDMSRMGRLGTDGVAALETDEPIAWQIQHRNGEPRHVESIATRRFDDPAIGGCILNTRDVTDRREIEATLVHRAFHDPLTDLANRALFEDRADHALHLRARQARVVAVLMVDLDHFKTVNDSLGHAAGDKLLVEVADRLRIALRHSDTAARLGGDEFAILVETMTDVPEIIALARRIMDVVCQPVTIDGSEIIIQMSMGIAIAEGEAVTAVDLLRDADLAMYVAKSRGRAGYAVFDASMALAATHRLGLMADLFHALARDELSLVYQPIVDLENGQTKGVEALIRWEHPGRGAVAPSVFIPIAEDTGLIVELGEWALRTATAQAVGWMCDGDSQGTGLRLAVNVSMHQLERPEFTEQVRSALADSGFPPHRLTLEITESALMRDPEAMLAQLAQIKTLGVTIAIDDFGTGYSSLAYLAKLPIDIVKIDRSFVERLSVGEHDADIASMIVGIGEILGLITVGEGVEELQQVADLRGLGCQMGQGFYFSRPLTPAALEEFLARATVAAR